ncbi:hypothetical protein TSO221_01605 [Azospirillum sp. TSO22-1]|nr:hypothetical protein TSO221_01605 [Azospirillum sp. TSO22-1]
MAALLLLAAPPVAAQAVQRGVFALEGKQVPLPDGDWIPAARTEEPDMVSVVLLHPHGARVAGAVLVQASRRDARPKWGEPPHCERHDLPFARTRYKSDHDLSCAYVAHVAGHATAELVDAAWPEARRFAAAQGWTVPAAWGVVAVRVAQPLAAVQVRYAAALDPAGSPGPAALAAWAEPAWTAVEHGLRNHLDAAAPLPALRGLPEPAAAAPTPEADGWSLPRAVWKTLTFRVIATSLDFTANLIASGSVATAATLSAFPIVIGPWVYLGHELAWEHYGAPAGLRTALPGLGEETPWPLDATRIAEKTP